MVRARAYAALGATERGFEDCRRAFWWDAAAAESLCGGDPLCGPPCARNAHE